MEGGSLIRAAALAVACVFCVAMAPPALAILGGSLLLWAFWVGLAWIFGISAWNSLLPGESQEDLLLRNCRENHPEGCQCRD